MKHISFIVFSSLILLSSCGLYKNYERPEDIKVDGIYGRALSGDSLGLGDLSWREVFTDPLLQGIIERGLTQNSNIRQADLRIQETQNNLKAAKLAFLPMLTFGAQGSVSGMWDPKDRGVLGGGSIKTYSLPLSAQWQIDCFGQLRNAKKGSEVAVENMQSVRQAVQTAVIANIATLYYTLCMLDEQIRITEQTKANWEKNLEVTKLLMEAGQSNKAAVASTEANYWSVCASIIELKDQITKTENTLANLIGEVPHTFERNTLASFQKPSLCVTGVPISILSRRPDVRQAELALASAFYGKNQAKASFFPALNISASGQYTNSLGNMVLNPGGIIASLVGSLAQPIFAQGKLRAAYKNAKAEMEIAQIGFQQSVLDAGYEVASSMARVKVFSAEQEYIDKQVVSLTEAVEATQDLMTHSNQVNYLNVLTAQSGLLGAQISQATNQFNIISSVIALYQALGGGTK